ncbi:MAG: pilus (MSHA type) biogenesis protein MshL [Thermodesulfobacteriota bacterium]
MKHPHGVTRIAMVALLALLCACAPAAKTRTAPPPAKEAEAQSQRPLEPGQLPVRFQQPSYMLKESAAGAQLGLGETTEIKIPVGADISSTTGPVALRDILKRLAALKKMNVSWASDVDQSSMVDVDIKAEDDFFEAIDNILRQVDYYHEVKGNTIVVQYRETRKFHVAMPFMKTTYNTAVGGDVLGSSLGTTSAVKGNIQITSENNQFDIWDNIKKNIDQILEIWEETVPAPAAATSTTPQAGAPQAPATQPAAATAATTTKRNVQAGKGYYSIDKPIGLITVTAPRPLVEKIATYLDNLKKELYRQVSIEAKIVEVVIDNTSTRGIDWTDFLSGKGLSMYLFGATATTNGVIYDPNRANRSRGVTKIEVTGNPFAVALDFLDTQGPSTVLANPKLSVMNGQPALISAGESIKYIDKVETTVSDSGVPTYTVTTATLMSGLGMSVLATIMENDEIILSLTPVTSKLAGKEDPDDVDYIDVGGVTVGVPRIKLREMNTTVRIKSGEVLVVGGLIDNAEGDSQKKVPFLGDVPGVGALFSHSTKTTKKTELIILLQPKIL